MVKNIAIVSLSRGVLGEEFARHEVEIGLARLAGYGVNVRFMPNALLGINFLAAHPEARAADLLQAFRDPEIDMILCAIGGDDTYRLLPYLFDHNELREGVTDKIFLGFSDTTVNHMMLHKVGLPTFYGQAFLPDICELSPAMLPYTEHYFAELLRTGTIQEVTPSDIWYESRTDFSPAQIGAAPAAYPDDGFQLLQGSPTFSGEILGGCIDTLYDFFDGTRYADMPLLCRKYGLFPTAEDWQGKILLLETSEELMPPEKYRAALTHLKAAGVFCAVSGVLIGKPMNRKYEDEYKQILVEVIDDPALPVVCNLNVGHAAPRCILPFGVMACVDAAAQRITFAKKQRAPLL